MCGVAPVRGEVGLMAQATCGMHMQWTILGCPLTLIEHSPLLAPAEGSFLYSSTSRRRSRSLPCRRAASCSTSAVMPATTRDSSAATLDLWAWELGSTSSQCMQGSIYHHGLALTFSDMRPSLASKTPSLGKTKDKALLTLGRRVDPNTCT
jgi:hypothetical protein